MENKHFKKTKDLWFASYLIEIAGYDILDYEEINAHKGVFYFDVSNKDWKNLKLEFDKSDLSKIKWRFEKLKDLIN